MSALETWPTVLSVAGSDSGGGAGIQADLKVFDALRCHGTTAITCITAQNPDSVDAVGGIDPDLVEAQIRAVTRAFPVAALKTGMLYSAPIIDRVCDTLEALDVPNVVIDPVMVATSGALLLREDALSALTERLILHATVVTPNIPEAERLLGARIERTGEVGEAARELERRFGTPFLVKGGHLGGNGAVVRDVLSWHGRALAFEVQWIQAVETHGTGCSFSAAICALLARGAALDEAARRAQLFVRAALLSPIASGQHRPLGIRNAAEA